MQKRTRVALAAVGVVVLAIAHFLPVVPHTTVTSHRRRASLAAASTFNALWVTGSALVAVAALGKNAPDGLTRCATALSLLMAVCTHIDDLYVVLVMALAGPRAWHGLPSLFHWPAIVAAYAYRSDHAVATLVMLPLLVLLDTAIEWLAYRSKTPPDDTVAALAAVIATLARMQ